VLLLLLFLCLRSRGLDVAARACRLTLSAPDANQGLFFCGKEPHAIDPASAHPRYAPAAVPTGLEGHTAHARSGSAHGGGGPYRRPAHPAQGGPPTLGDRGALLHPRPGGSPRVCRPPLRPAPGTRRPPLRGDARLLCKAA